MNFKGIVLPIILSLIGCLFWLRQNNHTNEKKYVAEYKVDDGGREIDRNEKRQSSNAFAVLMQNVSQFNFDNPACEAQKWQYSKSAIAHCIEHLVSEGSINKPLLLVAYQHWANMDLSAALTHLYSLPESLTISLFPDLINALSPDKLEQVLAWLNEQEFDTDRKTDLITQAYMGAANEQPEKALHEVELMQDYQLKSQVVDKVLISWGKDNPLAALDWVNSRSRPDMYTQVSQNLLFQLLDSQPSSAETYIHSMSEGPLKNLVVQRYAQQLAGDNFQLAIDWSLSLEDTSARNTSMSTVLALAAADSQYEDFAWDTAMNENDETSRQQFIKAISPHLAKDNIEKLVSNFADLPEDARYFVAGDIAKNWAESDSKGALQWAINLADKRNSDRAKYVIGEHAIPQDWKRTFEIAETISSSEERYMLIEKTIQHLALDRPDIARIQIEQQTHISEQQKKALNNLLKN